METISGSLGWKVFRPTQEVVAFHVVDSVEPEQNAFADFERFTFESELHLPLHVREERFHRFVEQLPGGLGWGSIASVVPPGSAPEVVKVHGTNRILHLVGHGLEGDLSKETAGDLLDLDTKICMRCQQPVQNGLRLAWRKPLEDRLPAGFTRFLDARPILARRLVS